MLRILTCIGTFVLILEGCAMLTAWKSIPPPGGCEQCHHAPISSNWAISYQAAFISDERGRNYFEIPEYNLQEQRKAKPPSGSTKFEELQCFECHKSPTPAHKERKGRFHH